jgi:hypothetical protein
MKAGNGRLVNISGSEGQSMVEFVIVVPTILFVILAAIQVGLIYQAKATLNLATFHAARAGSLSNADMDAIKQGLVEGLSPLYTYGTTLTDQIAGYAKAKGEVEGTEQRAVVVGVATSSSSATGTLGVFNPEGGHAPSMRVGPPSIIEILNPSTEVFTDHGEDDVDDDGNAIRLIPNDNLMFRSDDASGSSSINIQDANLLKIRVVFGYHLFVPLANTVIISLLRAADTGGAFSVFHDAQRFPLTSYATARMQTPAIQ